MSNTKRPSLVRKPATKASQAERKKALESGLRIVLDGHAYEVRYGDLTPTLTRELRAATGMGWFQLLDALAHGADIDLLAAFVWLARRVRGERLALDDVDLDYSAMFDLAEGDLEALDGDEEVDAADPEAIGGRS